MELQTPITSELPSSPVKGQSIPVNISAGLVVGVLVVFLQISLAALIFSAELNSYFGAGIGILLLGALVSMSIAIWFSEFNISINVPQDVPAAILAVMAATLVTQSGSGASIETFATVVIVMGTSTILTGILLWWLGHMNLGRLVRYLPYPVIGGFMAGTGWLLFNGGIGVLNDGGINSGLLNVDSMLLWVPALLLASIMLLVTRRFTQPLAMPLIVVSALILFFTVMTLAGGNFSSGLNMALENGWLLGPLPDTELWRPVTIDALKNANWQQVLGSSAGMLTIFLISSVSLLLNCSGLEIITKTDIDLNRELKTIGFTNIAGGLVGSSANYHMLSLSTLNHRLGATTRLAGFIAVMVVGATLVFGAGLLANTPKLIVSGFLIYLGLGFLADWIIDGWFKLPKIDYVLVWLILITIVFVGLIQGVIVGVLVAAGLFVIAYTSTDAVRHTFTRDKYQSHIMRSRSVEKRLVQHGDGFYVMELQGFIFFGMAHQLLDRVKSRIRDSSHAPIRYLLLDFRLVTGLDSSASYSFSRLAQITSQAGIALGYSGVNPDFLPYLSNRDEGRSDLTLFEDINHGIAWFDDKDIAEYLQQGEDILPDPLLKYFQNTLSKGGSEPVDVEDRLLRFMQFQEMTEGTVLLNEGDSVDFVYFIEAGEVSIQTSRNGQAPNILRIQSAGTVFGEIGIYTSATATATVVVTRDARLFSLSVDDFHRMDSTDPELAIVVHRLIAATLGRKLTQTSNALVALQK